MTQRYFEQKQKELQKLREEHIQTKRKLGEVGSTSVPIKNPSYVVLEEKMISIETFIKAIEEELGFAEVIDPHLIPCDVVSVASIVTVSASIESSTSDLFTDCTEEIYYFKETGVNLPEASMVTQRSPVGRALLDKRIGDTMRVATPQGIIYLKVEKIEKIVNTEQ